MAKVSHFESQLPAETNDEKNQSWLIFCQHWAWPPFEDSWSLMVSATEQ